MSGRLRWPAAAAIMLALALVLLGCAGSARADYTETFCANSPPPPYVEAVNGTSPFTELVDLCAEGSTGGSYQFGNNSETYAPGSTYGFGLEAPAGEVFTNLSFAYTFQPWTGGSNAFMEFGYGAGTILSYGVVPSDPGTGTFAAALPDVSQFYGYLLCSDSSQTTCDYNFPQGVVQMGSIAITLHDTAPPTVSATGGSLSSTGTVKGTQSVLYSASATGSGVEAVSVSLGPTVVGSTPSACQTPSLTPCPTTVSGSVTANTALVPDGTYPVILTAANMSGDTDPVQIGTVTVANDVSAVTLPTPAPAKHGTHARHRPVHVHAVFHWDPLASATRLDRVTIDRVPHRARISLACTGARCPFASLKARAGHLTPLLHHLRRRRFATGDHLAFTATAPGRTAQKATMIIRHGTKPKVVSGIHAAHTQDTR